MSLHLAEGVDGWRDTHARSHTQVKHGFSRTQMEFMLHENQYKKRGQIFTRSVPKNARQMRSQMTCQVLRQQTQMPTTMSDSESSFWNATQTHVSTE